ncbi:putative lipoprotein [Sulfurihydrogenibium azorense Az-Fu1]|uniref:Putative lipoprotein n=1 Tax=Sulfurihydrogenibium azorense (strain DSM 15241 / OCM 825 / Az-Fu1) TaxID=204536 RepID=C1DWB2_SULAA|nr:hypothetical protein [Sulfurihydrogenibium azorense]ACN98783.1 putative lipoprotein [Sulfurihydrogenibium azorense Az-Fu1]
MEKLLTLLLTFVLAGCTVKDYNTYKPKEKKVICFKDLVVNTPEPTLKDILYKNISDGVLQSGNKLECGEKTNYNLYITLNSVRFYTIGYSPSQRANVYAVEMNINVKLEDLKGNILKDKTIREKTQYVGTGLRSDFEKRYAFEELGKLIKVRVLSILSEP